jgi:uncharacterized protein (DUF1778 family)
LRDDGYGDPIDRRQGPGVPAERDQLSETELRVRKAVVIPEDEIRFSEERVSPLSDRDRDRFLELLDNPPKANPALRRAAAKAAKRHG